MTYRPITTQRGLTLIELMLAMAITAMVGAAIATLLGAVAAGVHSQRDTRSHIVRANAAQARLGAYINPSHCLLMAADSAVVVWFRDSRESNSVHGTEIRWLIYDPAAKAIKVHFVKFPDSWSVKNRMMYDFEHSKDSNWMSVLGLYTAMGNIDTVTLVDGVTNMQVSTDHMTAMDSRHVAMRLTFEEEGGEVTSMIVGTLMRHRTPAY